MKVAAYQHPLAVSHTADAISVIAEQMARCEGIGVEILCCPEAILGGLADYAGRPLDTAIASDRLGELLAPLASDSVTTIVGFTEINRSGTLYNSAAVYQRGSVRGVYRKQHPAINRSAYAAGVDTPVFTIGDLTFGILICRDSRFPEHAQQMAALGATALFIPTNNGMPPSRGGAELVAEARRSDVACAVANGVAVIRADVAGRTAALTSFGASHIVEQDGRVLASSRQSGSELLIAEIDVHPRRRQKADISRALGAA